MFDPVEFAQNYAKDCHAILGDNLVGVYLHGSAVMGCFNPVKSDVDLIVVTDGEVSESDKRQFMELTIRYNLLAPEKGLEVSIVCRSVCNPFVYPTPFELHFSNMHRDWYKNDPDGYIKNMNGTDKDLAAHFTIIRHRGKTILGEEIPNVFGEVQRDYYFDSIWNDIESAEEDFAENPVYITLNLCRVLAYKRDGLVLSKAEGGRWGLANGPAEFHALLTAALEEYEHNLPMDFSEDTAKAYVSFMLNVIKD